MTAPKPARKMKPVMAWGGFSDGKMHWFHANTGYGVNRILGVFKTKKSARVEYQDVRRVRITEVTK